MANKPMDLTMEWEQSLRFRATSSAGQEIRLDGNAEQAPSPMQTLLASLAGCMCIDIVDILGKMRVPPEHLSVRIQGERMEDPPRRFRRVTMSYRIRGAVPRDKAERALALSLEKYCSVYHSLRPDLEVDQELVIEP